MKPATYRSIWLAAGRSGRGGPAGRDYRDDEARSPAWQAFRLRDAEPADHLDRGGLADPLEDGAGHVARGSPLSISLGSARRASACR